MHDALFCADAFEVASAVGCLEATIGWTVVCWERDDPPECPATIVGASFSKLASIVGRLGNGNAPLGAHASEADITV
jgi:hypothetical protein